MNATVKQPNEISKIAALVADAPPLAVAKGERATLTTRLAELDGILTTLSAAQATEREASAALGALAEAEVVAVKAWASGGCIGPAPGPDMAAREAAARKLAEATANAAAVRVVAGDVGAEADTIRRRLDEIKAEIEAHAVDALLDHYTTNLARTVAFAKEVAADMGAFCGSIEFLREQAEAHATHGRHEQARLLYTKLEHIRGLPVPEFMPTTASARSAIPAWREVYDSLRG